MDYFDELLERIRDIRASERRVYLRVRENLALVLCLVGFPIRGSYPEFPDN